MTSSRLAALHRSVAVQRRELRADLAACWTPASASTADQWLTRPSILRRVSSLLSERIPRGTDRIATAGVGATILGAALSLETGLPFVSLPHGTNQGVDQFGVFHCGENAVLIQVILDDDPSWVSSFGATGMNLTATLAVLGASEQSATTTLFSSLTQLDEPQAVTACLS